MAFAVTSIALTFVPPGSELLQLPVHCLTGSHPRSDQNLGFWNARRKTSLVLAGPRTIHGDTMGTFTWTCARTCKFLFNRTILRRRQCTSSNLVKNMQTQFFVGASDGQLKLHEKLLEKLAPFEKFWSCGKEEARPGGEILTEGHQRSLENCIAWINLIWGHTTHYLNWSTVGQTTVTITLPLQKWTPRFDLNI